MPWIYADNVRQTHCIAALRADLVPHKNPMNFQPILEKIVATLRPHLGLDGAVANYAGPHARQPVRHCPAHV